MNLIWWRRRSDEHVAPARVVASVPALPAPLPPLPDPGMRSWNARQRALDEAEARRLPEGKPCPTCRHGRGWHTGWGCTHPGCMASVGTSTYCLVSIVDLSEHVRWCRQPEEHKRIADRATADTAA